MKECIFCKIVNGEIPCYKIYEDNKFMAFLTPFPNTPGVTVVIPKKHFNSYIFGINKEVYIKFMITIKKIALNISKKLDLSKCALVFEGTGINHLHAKIYPLHGKLGSKTNVWVRETVFFKSYPGYITTLEGPKANDKELKKLQNILKIK